MAWYNQNWVTVLVTLVGLAIFYRQLRAMAKRNEFDVRERAGAILKSQFDKVDGGAPRFYELRHRFKQEGDRSRAPAANPDWGRSAYQAAMERRLEMVVKLPDEQRSADLAVVAPVVNALNDVAELIDLNFLEAPLILSKYHLLLAREVFLLEPYILYEVLLADRGRWGYRVLRLGEMARKYNDMNPVHRRAIYFLQGDRPDTEFGPIYLAPDSPWRWLLEPCWLVRRRLFGYPTITEWVKRRQNREMQKLDERTHHLRHTPPLVPAAPRVAGGAQSTE